MADIYEYPTNYSNGTELTNPSQFFLDWPSTIIPNYGPGLIVLIFSVSLILSILSGSRKALAVASFISLIFSTWFWVAGILSITYPIGLLLVFIVSIIVSVKEASL